MNITELLLIKSRYITLPLVVIVIALSLVGFGSFAPNANASLYVDNEQTNSVLNSSNVGSILGETDVTEDLISNLQDVRSQDFYLTIPSIGVNSHVLANVNPSIETEYAPVIEDEIAHGKYTRLPSEAVTNGNVYMFAHREGIINGKYVGIFKRLNELQDGDLAYVKFGDNTYVYQYQTQFIITPYDTWVYTGESAKPTLTLQTCENGDSMRLIAKFELIEVRS